MSVSNFNLPRNQLFSTQDSRLAANHTGKILFCSNTDRSTETANGHICPNRANESTGERWQDLDGDHGNSDWFEIRGCGYFKCISKFRMCVEMM